MWSRKQPPAPQAQSASREEMVQRQVATLYSFFPNSVQVIEGNSRYQVHVNVGPSRTRLALEVALPGDFPDAAPIISVAPSVAQRWVSHDMRVVGHEALATWHRNLSVGKVVKDIEIEFNLRPPTVVVSPNPPPQAAASNPPLAQDLPFPEVDSKNAKQLKELLDQDDKFAEFFDSTTAVRETRAIQDDLVRGNLELARRNLERKRDIDALKERLSELQTLLELEEAELKKASEKHRDALSKYSDKTLIAGLMERIGEHEEASDRLADALRNDAGGGVDIEKFISAFRGSRLQYHRRTMDVEKLRQYLH